MNKIQRFFIAQKANITLWYASRQADKAYMGKYPIGRNKDNSKRYKIGNTRYYVIPDENERLICINRNEFRKLKRKKYISDKAQLKDLKSESFYFTPNCGGKNPISDELKEYKRRKYIEYCLTIAERKNKTR